MALQLIRLVTTYSHAAALARGPLPVQRHNALCEVIFQVSQVKKGQNCSGYDSSRPGDVYHPDFMNRRPGYFDVTIRNSLQPSYILKAVLRPGAAAEAAEFEKNARHKANVTTAGGLFYPLVFNLWASYRLSL